MLGGVRGAPHQLSLVRPSTRLPTGFQFHQLRILPNGYQYLMNFLVILFPSSIITKKYIPDGISEISSSELVR